MSWQLLVRGIGDEDAAVTEVLYCVQPQKFMFRVSAHPSLSRSRS